MQTGNDYTATVQDVADAINVKKNWVYQQTRLIGKVDDPIPCLIVGKYRRFNIAEVIEWLKRKNHSGQTV